MADCVEREAVLPGHLLAKLCAIIDAIRAQCVVHRDVEHLRACAEIWSSVQRNIIASPDVRLICLEGWKSLHGKTEGMPGKSITPDWCHRIPCL